MLKTKLHKAGFIVTSFMLMAAASGNKKFITADHNPANTTGPADSLCVSKHVFDTTGLCICLPALSATDMQSAPRVFLQKEVRSFVEAHLRENALYYDKIKVKSGPVFKMIDQVFSSYNIPEELKYLAVVESKLDNRIVSTSGAVGLWQFMPVAAKSFGLRINGKQDDRRNDYKSTVAAAKCLVYLNGIFDDWLLTLAAYNSGPARVLSAIRKSGSRNYWELEKWLSPETRKHVKKFISVHYHFEGHGSLVTMTRAETTAHTNEVAAFLQKTQISSNDSLLLHAEDVSSKLK